MRYFLLSILLSVSFFSLAVNPTESESEKKDTSYQIQADDLVLVSIDSALSYWNKLGLHLDTSIQDSTLIVSDTVFPIVDSIVSKEMEMLNSKTPLDLTYNQYVKAFINLYLNKRRNLSENVLGLAPHYYPMFEEAMDRHQIPLELKHLAVVESALNPSARSWVGAQGLWQFMYGTAKIYKLKVTSYYDDRMDPYKATDAACRYMKDLYGLYGDWNLVLAAYNSGPGNVNKAIRRAGGVKDYWAIRPFLPRETRGYVPAFIAVNYVLSYADKYGLRANLKDDLPLAKDTVVVNNMISLKDLATYLNTDYELLKKLNPRYKVGFVPESKTGNTIAMPQKEIGLFLTNEKAIWADLRRKEIADSIAGKEKTLPIPEALTHRVRSGEFLGYIANKYNCSVRDLMRWNNLRNSRINPGDRLVIYSKAVVHKKKSSPAQSNRSSQAESTANSGEYQFHTVRNGDTLWDIAKQYSNTSVNDLKKLNSNLNFKRLKPGMQVKIKQIG